MNGFSFNFDINAFLLAFGNNPIQGIWFIFIHGGWIIFLILFFLALSQIWLVHVQTKAAKKKKYVVLAIDIPKLKEKDKMQAVRSVENIFAHLAGAHSSINWREEWFQGAFQDPIAFEIVSINGQIQFLIRCLDKVRDLVESSIFAQYPEVEITEVEDYSLHVPGSFPNKDWDMWGTEMVPVTNDCYPLKTYPDFEDKMSSEFKDPIAVLLEAFSRLGPGEQAWFQIIALPIAQNDFVKKSSVLVKKLKGEKIESKPSTIEKILLAPFNFLAFLFGNTGSSSSSSSSSSSGTDKMLLLTPGERKIIEAVENKASKIAYLSKIRFVYVAKKKVFKKPKIVSSMIGFIKQMNTNNMLALKPDLKHIGMSNSIIFFKDKRNNSRKSNLMSYYRGRSAGWAMPPFFLNTEELATLWHFPHTFQVKTSTLKKKSMKTLAPPIDLPFAEND